MNTLQNGKRSPLPSETNDWFLTDGGLETTLVFHQGRELPHFAAFDLLKTEEGYRTLREYYERYTSLALKYRTNFILESATWRANMDWGSKLGYDDTSLYQANVKAIDLLWDIREDNQSDISQFLISGCIGPRGDGYSISSKMTIEDAEVYHRFQSSCFRQAGVDLISAVTMTYAEEAIGITLAAASIDVPVVISFTVETDGRLPSGQLLKDAVSQVDAVTGNGPAYYMVNCAHPQHFMDVLSDKDHWLDRIRGVRANASTKSHAELDACETLDDGNPSELGDDYTTLKGLLKNLNVLGGCCGTDHRHVEEIYKAVVRPVQA